MLSIGGLAVLVSFAALRGDSRAVVASAVYGVTLILLYTASTLYHAVPVPAAKPLLRTLDHIAIYLLIAGTYTPFTLLALPGVWGWSLFAAVWTLALVGSVLELGWFRRWRKLPCCCTWAWAGSACWRSSRWPRTCRRAAWHC